MFKLKNQVSIQHVLNSSSQLSQADQLQKFYLVSDRERNRSEGKSGLKQNISLFEKNSWLFDENNGMFWSNPAFP